MQGALPDILHVIRPCSHMLPAGFPFSSIWANLMTWSLASKIWALSLFFLAWPRVISDTRLPKPRVLMDSPYDEHCSSTTQEFVPEQAELDCQEEMADKAADLATLLGLINSTPAQTQKGSAAAAVTSAKLLELAPACTDRQQMLADCCKITCLTITGMTYGI